MRVSSSVNSSAAEKPARKRAHPYEAMLPSITTWHKDESPKSGDEADDDEAAPHDMFNPTPPQPAVPIFYPAPSNVRFLVQDEQGFPTYARYLEVENAYLLSHTAARRDKIFLDHRTLCDVAQVLARFLTGTEGAAPPADGLMANDGMRRWAQGKFALADGGGVTDTTTGRPMLAREQFYQALCWAHGKAGHAGRDKTARLVNRYAGIPKQLVMNFVAACPSCAPKKPGVYTRPKEGNGYSLPPLRRVLEAIDMQGFAQTPVRHCPKERAPQDVSPLSPQRPPRASPASPDDSFFLPLPAPYDTWPTYPAIGDGTAQKPVYHAAEAGAAAAPQEWERVDGPPEGYGLHLSTSDSEMYSFDASAYEADASAASSYGPIRGRYASSGSSDSPDSSMVSSVLSLDGSPACFSGWSPPSPSPFAAPLPALSFGSPKPGADADTSSLFGSPKPDARLYNTPLRRVGERDFEQRLEAMYCTFDASLTHALGLALPPLQLPLPAPAPAEGGRPVSFLAKRSAVFPASSREPVTRARALSTSLGLSIQTNAAAQDGPTPPLTASSAASSQSPTTPGFPFPRSLYTAQPAPPKADNSYASTWLGDGDVLSPRHALNEWNEWADMGFVYEQVEEVEEGRGGGGWAYPAVGA